jgi:hypothetical protein
LRREILMATAASSSWFPLFEFQEWAYESTLINLTPGAIDPVPDTALTATRWAKGTLSVGQAFTAAGDRYTLDGDLSFASGVTLKVSASGALGSGSAPATFTATGIGTDGPTKGASYDLVGWVFPEEPIANQAARVLTIRGSVRAVRGPDARPATELGGMPVGTVGAFLITRRTSQA